MDPQQKKILLKGFVRFFFVLGLIVNIVSLVKIIFTDFGSSIISLTVMGINFYLISKCLIYLNDDSLII